MAANFSVCEMPYSELRTITETDVLSDPFLNKLLDHWRGLRKGRTLPPRADFDPTAFGSDVRNMTLVDVIDGGADYEARLVGTGIEEVLSVVGGLGRLSALADRQVRENYRQMLDRVVATAQPVFARGYLDVWTRRNVAYATVLLPFCASGDGVEIILQGVQFSERVIEPENQRSALADEPDD